MMYRKIMRCLQSTYENVNTWNSYVMRDGASNIELNEGFTFRMNDMSLYLECNWNEDQFTIWNLDRKYIETVIPFTVSQHQTIAVLFRRLAWLEYGKYNR